MLCNSKRFLVLSKNPAVKLFAYSKIKGSDLFNGKSGNLYLMDAENLEQFKFENVVTDNNRLVKYII